MHTCTLRVIPLCCLTKMAMLCMWDILAKANKKYKIIVPWRRFKCCLSNDLSPSKRMLRYLTTLLIMVIRWLTPVPLTSKDRVAYQINGKTTMSKEKKMNKKDIWVGRLLLVTCSIFKQLSLLFSKQTHTFPNILQTLKTFSKKKDKHLYIHSYEW